MSAKNLNSQDGAILFISLVMLLVLTLLGVSALQTTTLEERMAGNARDQSLALQAAETALRQGERWILQRTSEPSPISSCSSGCSTVVWQLNTLNNGNYWDNSLWTGNSVRSYSGGTLPKIKTPPKYIVEYHTFVKDTLTMGKASDNSGRAIFRITARGTGGSDEAQAIVQSTYSRRF